MCHIWSKPHTDEISLDGIINIFSNRAFLKSLKVVDITGGEPFLRSDLAEIVEYFSIEFPKASILITTNAYSTNLIEALGRKILDTCPKDRLEFSVSIDGPQEVHDKMRGRVGSYKNAIESIKVLKSLGAKKITLSTTIVKENRDSLLFVYDLAQKLNVVFSTARFAQRSFYYGNPMLDSWSPSELKDVEKEISALIKARRACEGMSLQLLRDAYFMREALAHHRFEIINKSRTIDATALDSRQSKRSCFSGTHSFFIDPNANVFPCVMLDKIIGNALKDDLEKIWFSPSAQEVREFIARGNCACHTECETFLSMQRNVSDIAKILLGAFKP